MKLVAFTETPKLLISIDSTEEVEVASPGSLGQLISYLMDIKEIQP